MSSAIIQPGLSDGRAGCVPPANDSRHSANVVPLNLSIRGDRGAPIAWLAWVELAVRFLFEPRAIDLVRPNSHKYKI